MPYIHFTSEQKERANSVDLADFLLRRGEKLIPSGREKRLERDHSITIRGSQWYDHEAEKGGGAISFVQNLYGLSYPEAVTLLLGRLVKHIEPLPWNQMLSRSFPFHRRAPPCVGCTHICSGSAVSAGTW